MKTIRFTAFSILFGLLMLVSACKKETNPAAAPQTGSKILVTGQDAGTGLKSTLSGQTTVWVASIDEVGIFSPQARPTSGGTAGVTNRKYKATTSASFSAFSPELGNEMYWGTNDPHLFYAYYPYSATAGTNATLVPINLATGQTQSAGDNSAHIGALDFLVATPVSQAPGGENGATTVNLHYNHVFTVLEFQIKRSSGSGKITKVKLTAATNLSLTSGTIDITQATYAINSGSTGTKEITLTITGGVTPTADYATTPKIYMVILPGDFSAESMTIGLEYESSGVFENTTKTGKIFARGTKYVVQMEPTYVTDVEGNVYNTVTINSQIWMTSNLKTTKYNDGTAIPNVTDNTLWNNATAGAYCDYANTASNSTTYGKLYNWFVVDNNESTKVASNGGKNVCPTGWHVPTDAEWTTLTDYLGGASVAGGKLKETGTTHWINPNAGATNETGFTALPGGYRTGSAFYSIGIRGRWWSSSTNAASDAWNRVMSNDGSGVDSSINDKQYGFSVRCLRDF